MVLERMNAPMIRRTLMLLALALLPAACGGSDATESADSSKTTDAVGIPESYWSEADLPGAMEVGAARKDAKDGDEVVLVGRVKDFVDGRAVFTLIDVALAPCNDNPEDVCPTPWDYCCIESNVQAENTVTVEVLGDDKRPLATAFKGFHGLDHLDTVTVRGTPTRDASGNVTLALASLHRR